METTGVGLGGSGGAGAGRVKEILMKKVGHLIPMDKVVETAQHCSTWIASELAGYRKNEELLQRFRKAQNENERYTITEKHSNRLEQEYAILMKAEAERRESKL